MCMMFIVAMSVHHSSSLSITNVDPAQHDDDAVIPPVVDFLRYRTPSNDSSNLLFRLQIDLSHDMFAQARSACEFLYSDCDRSQRKRCLHDALVTLRHEKVKLMLSTYSNEIEDSCDADILALGPIYDFNTSLGSTSQNVDVVCIVGSVANHSILTILHALAVKAVRLFIPAELMTENYARYIQDKQILAGVLNKSLSVHVGDPVEELMKRSDTSDAHGALMCTILHLEDNTYSKDDLSHIAASLVASFLKSDRHYGPEERFNSCWPKTIPSPMRVVMMESKMYVPAMDEYSTIQRLNLDHTLPPSISMDGLRVDTWIRWTMSSMWYWQTRFVYSRYLDGFLTYAPYQNTTHFLNEISAGLVHVRCTSEETMRSEAVDPPPVGSTTTCGDSSACEVRESDNARVSSIIIIITYVNRVFAETANGLKRALESIGYNEVSILPELTMSSHMAAVRTHQRPALLQIAIGPHDLSLFSTNYLILHTEQPWFIQIASNF